MSCMRSLRPESVAPSLLHAHYMSSAAGCDPSLKYSSITELASTCSVALHVLPLGD